MPLPIIMGHEFHGEIVENDQGEPHLLIGPTAMASALAEFVTSRHVHIAGCVISGEDPDNLLDNITETYRWCVKAYL